MFTHFLVNMCCAIKPINGYMGQILSGSGAPEPEGVSFKILLSLLYLSLRFLQSLWTSFTEKTKKTNSTFYIQIMGTIEGTKHHIGATKLLVKLQEILAVALAIIIAELCSAFSLNVHIHYSTF